MSAQHHPLAAPLALAAGLFAAIPSPAQVLPPVTVPPAAATLPDQPADPAAQLDTLLARLAEPGRGDWQKIQGEILAIWSRSGSPAMDLLLRRGEEALKAGDTRLALERLDALTDHAPEFAEAWNARATAWYLEDEFALALADIERALALNPRHFGALAGLGTIYEQLGDTDGALAAMRAVRALNPNHPDLDESIRRLEASRGLSDI